MRVAGIKAQYNLPLERRLHEQVPEVVREHLDGALTGGVKQIVPDLALNGGGYQPVVRIGDGFPHVRLRRRAVAGQHPVVQVSQHDILRHRQRHLEELLLLAAVDGKDAVPGQLAERLGEIIVHGIHRILLLGGFAGQRAGVKGQAAQFTPIIGIVRHLLRHDVHGSLQGGGNIRHLAFGIHKTCRLLLDGRRIALFLREQQDRQILQSPLPRDRGTGLALGAEGAVDVVHLGDGGGTLNGCANLLGQLALRADQILHLLLPLGKVAQCCQLFVQRAQDAVVQTARDLLAVPGNEGNGVPFVDQLYRFSDLLRSQVQLLCQCLYDIHLLSLRFSFVVMKGNAAQCAALPESRAVVGKDRGAPGPSEASVKV